MSKRQLVPFTKLIRRPEQPSKSFVRIASWRSLLACTLLVGTGGSVARPIYQVVHLLPAALRIGTRHTHRRRKIRGGCSARISRDASWISTALNA
jgi:hypothetical protein